MVRPSSGPDTIKNGSPFVAHDVISQRWSVHGPATQKPNHNWAIYGKNSAAIGWLNI